MHVHLTSHYSGRVNPPGLSALPHLPAAIHLCEYAPTFTAACPLPKKVSSLVVTTVRPNVRKGLLQGHNLSLAFLPAFFTHLPAICEHRISIVVRGRS